MGCGAGRQGGGSPQGQTEHTPPKLAVPPPKLADHLPNLADNPPKVADTPSQPADAADAPPQPAETARQAADIPPQPVDTPPQPVDTPLHKTAPCTTSDASPPEADSTPGDPLKNEPGGRPLPEPPLCTAASPDPASAKEAALTSQEPKMGEDVPAKAPGDAGEAAASQQATPHNQVCAAESCHQPAGSPGTGLQDPHNGGTSVDQCRDCPATGGTPSDCPERHPGTVFPELLTSAEGTAEPPAHAEAAAGAADAQGPSPTAARHDSPTLTEGIAPAVMPPLMGAGPPLAGQPGPDGSSLASCGSGSGFTPAPADVATAAAPAELPRTGAPAVDYTSPETLVKALGEGHTAFIHAEWFVKQWRSGGRLRRRQDIEAEDPSALLRDLSVEDVWDMAVDENGTMNIKSSPGKYLLVAISYPWWEPEHPDPDGQQLILLGHFLEQMQAELEMLGKSIVVFLDYCSLYQKKRLDHEDEWTEAQQRSFKRGLQNVNIWYAHELVQVWALTNEISPSIAGYHERGWCTFEWQVSLLASRFVFVVTEVPMYHNLLHWDGGDFLKLGALWGIQARSEPPTLPADFRRIIAEKKFTCRDEDLEFVQDKYERVFYDVLAGTSGLSYEICDVDEDKAKWFVDKVIPFCHKLQDLNLSSHACITDASLLLLPERCPNLRKLQMARCTGITNTFVSRLAEHCPLLQVLQLTSCLGVTDSSVSMLAEKCGKLRVLHLDGCVGVTDASVLRLAEGCRNLETLLLTGCLGVTDASVSSLAKNCPHLQTLSLDQCIGVTDESVAPLADNCPDLSALMLSGCAGVTDISGLRLASNCAKLQKLMLADCTGVTGASVSALAANCKELQALDLSGCFGVTAASVQELADSCLNLLSLDLDFRVNLTDECSQQLLNRGVQLHV